MASVFKTADTLRTEYTEITYSQITGTDATTAVYGTCLRMNSKMFSIVNNVDAELEVMIVNPEDVNQKKLTFTRLGTGQFFALDAISGGMLEFPAKTVIYLHVNGAAATTGKVRMFFWA
jgi:predicted ester cyclase